MVESAADFLQQSAGDHARERDARRVNGVQIAWAHHALAFGQRDDAISVGLYLHDIYATGGRPVAMVNALWSRPGDAAQPLLDGMATLPNVAFCGTSSARG